MSESQRAILRGVVAQWGYGKSGNWKWLYWTDDVEVLISVGFIARHEESFNHYRPTPLGMEQV